MPKNGHGDGDNVPEPTQEGLDEVLDRAHAEEEGEEEEDAPD